MTDEREFAKITGEPSVFAVNSNRTHGLVMGEPSDPWEVKLPINDRQISFVTDLRSDFF